MRFDRARSGCAPATRASVRQAAPRATAQPVRVAPDATRWIEASGRGGLVAIRAAIGVAFVACGATGLFKLAPVDLSAVQPHGALAVGGAAMIAGALLPLLKGVEVLIEVILDRMSTQRASRRC